MYVTISQFELVALLVAALGSLLWLARTLRHLGRLRAERDGLVQEKEVVFNFLHDVSEVFAEEDSVDFHPLLERVLFYALRTTGAGAGVLYLLEPNGEELRAHAVSRLFPPLAGGVDAGIDRALSKVRYIEGLVKKRMIRRGEGLVGDVAESGVPILIEDAERDPRVPKFDLDYLRIHSILLVPMRFHHQVMGVLAVVNPVDGEPFLQADQSLLQVLADQASVSISFAKYNVALDEKRRLDYDLGIARDIQRQLLPKEIPQVPGVELAAFSVPAKEVGGDYYDFIAVDDTHLGIVIADVSGKSVAGAIVMSVCRSVLRTMAPGCLSPAHVLRSLNRVMSEDIPEDMFVSVLYMILDTRTHELVVARAGHVRPIVNPRERGEPWTIDSEGIAIGMLDPDTFDAALDENRTALQPGDMVVGYTDGVTEAMDQRQHEWGVLNLIKTIQITAMDREDVAHLVANVQRKLLQFAGNTPQYDDMTLVAMRITQ
ncbi:MAG: SpoIIE family protein phosphatase [Kiritimatiellae bacterium]|nr:SpoIIE family protein phosphatase [Kiritimatiellia bacterium]